MMNNQLQPPGRVAVFLSGRGSNFEAIYRHSLNSGANFRVVLVISDQALAPGLRKAKNLGLPALAVFPRSFASKSDYEKMLIAILEEHRVELICLAGYMRVVGADLLERFPDRIMNIHPALLPAFPGLDAQRQALDSGVKITGCTVHFVDAGVDSGPIILQRAVVINETDSVETLSQRILEQEHQVYSQAIELFFSGRLQVRGRKVIIGV